MQSDEFRTGVIKPVECFKEGWNAIKDQYLILFAITVVGMVIGSFTLYLLLGAMVCGIFYCYLQAIDGKPAEMEVLFKSFKYFKPGLLVIFFFVAPLFVVIGLYAPLLYATYSGQVLTEEEVINLLIRTLISEAIFATVMVCLHTLLVFAFPLIVDRNLSGWKAIKLSAKAVWKNLNGVAGLWAIGFVISLVGLLIFCIGIYLTIPLIIAGNTVAYRKVFPKISSAN